MMLGEINLAQWRCVAELVDNSVDGFLRAVREGHPITSPKVHVTLPTSDQPQATVVVKDNGPGMDPAMLEKAVRAGWTANDPINYLGMFGMGFNIATARLGTVTRVWTSTRDAAERSGLVIDFDQLVRQRHFRTPRLAEAKRDRHEHGTEVAIERLKPEQRQWFAKAANRSKVGKELSKAYTSMLGTGGYPISFQLYIGPERVDPLRHCIWGSEGSPPRIVPTTRWGPVNPYQQINVQLPERRFCTNCWQWLPPNEGICPACGEARNVVPRERRVYGWLGIQRYQSETEYGIDFVRHGRKIEMGNKELFYWSPEGEAQEEEYPIDDPRHKGRIVGEIHLDHCRVAYTKDRFDRNDPAWEEMVKLVRGPGPLRPERAQEVGSPENRSPLYILYQLFRRPMPKPRTAPNYQKLLVVPNNDLAEQMARRFYAGDPAYQTDEKWYQLAADEDRRLVLAETTPGGGAAQPEGLSGLGEESGSGGQAGTTVGSVGVVTIPRTPNPTLTREYREEATGLHWNVRAFEVAAADPVLSDGQPWASRVLPDGSVDFYLNPGHEIFRSVTLTPLDALITELAVLAMDFQRGSDNPVPHALVLSNLREKYAVGTRLDPIELQGESTLTLTAIARAVARGFDGETSRRLFEGLSAAEQEATQQRMATRRTPNPREAISTGRFLEFAPRRTMLRLFESNPELFFDGNVWDVEYGTLDYGSPASTEEARAQLIRYYASLLTDAIWLAEEDPTDLARTSRPRLLRAAVALELLGQNVVRPEGET